MHQVPAPADADSSLERAASILSRSTVAVITGAGVSTDSGIPDYRGEGSAPRNPMTFQQFMGSHAARQRYWAGSHRGWQVFRAARPNATHRTFAEWESSGWVTGVVTQNVDGLHAEAGSRRLVELHGTVSQVLCMGCRQMFARDDIAARLESANPGLRTEVTELHPDGDADVGDVSNVVIPDCTVCGGILKPDVVFFGELVPSSRFSRATDIVRSANAVLVAGSSLAVNSAVRLVDRARRQRKPVIIINRGPTKGDAKATVRIDGGVAESLAVLSELIKRPRPDTKTGR